MKLKAQTHTSIFELSAYYYCNKIWKELESRERSIIAWKLCIYILASYFMIHGVKKLIIKLCFHFVQCKQKTSEKVLCFLLSWQHFWVEDFIHMSANQKLLCSLTAILKVELEWNEDLFFGLPIDYSCKVSVQIFQWLLRKRLK